MTHPPEAVLIAGANGAGKTTFASEFLRLRHPRAAFLNADEIQREDAAFANPVAAGRELIRRLDDLVAQRAPFAVETTLASRHHVARLRSWSAAGYRTTLHFLELPSAEDAVRRVAQRVAAGGHAIPENDIRRRFARGLEMFASVYRTAVDQWWHGHSDGSGLRGPTTSTALAAEAAEGELWREAARRATWNALHGPRHLRAGRFWLPIDR